MKPLCFVLMPFGDKPRAGGGLIRFDDVYGQVIRPAIEDAGMEAIRADEERFGGIIHKPMFERLLLCEYAVADLTSANANVFYELGIRHAARPHSTVPLFAEGERLPFDVNLLRAAPYVLDADGRPADPARDRASVVKKLRDAKAAGKGNAPDSPVFQLLADYGPPDIERLRTDVFRERAEYSEGVKAELDRARRTDAGAVQAIEGALGPIEDADSGVAVDLLLSYRATSAWNDMLRVADAMPDPLRRSVLVREQRAFALNRLGRGEEAEAVLVELIDERGPSSETLGILGRVHKDRWDAARAEGRPGTVVNAFLRKAIDAYLRGFEADWRDAYPGINAVTLMEFTDPVDPRQPDLIPVVEYAVRRRIEGGRPDFWDHATMLELTVLGRDEAHARTVLGDVLTTSFEPWQPESTARNLGLIRDARVGRSEDVGWIEAIVDALNEAGG